MKKPPFAQWFMTPCIHATAFQFEVSWKTKSTGTRWYSGINLAAGILTLLVGLTPMTLHAEAEWHQSYDAGYIDANGAYAGGSEIMHIVAHQGKLYAANGYWVDARWVIPPDPEKQSAQVLRLDAADTEWQVDLDLGQHNDELGLQYMKGNILKSVTFTRDANGAPLSSPQRLLVMAAGANMERGGAVSAWVRDDAESTWTHALVRHGSSLGGIRWVPRDMEVYIDKVTGRELLLLSLGNPGIVSGQYDPAAPGKIHWSRHLEYPFPETGSFKTRPLGMVEANGKLFLSEGGAIYQRVDGERPDYREVLNLQEDTDTDIGGIRGLTTIQNPNGPGQSLLFLWAPAHRSQSQIKRLDPDGQGGFTLHDEVRMVDLMADALEVPIPYTLGAHNRMFPVKHPETGETVHLIGFQGNIRGKHHLRWPGTPLYAGAMLAVRTADQRYSLQEVNNTYRPGKTPLVAPRTFCLSPFRKGELYIGGHDASRKVSDDMAWIFRAPVDVVLGLETAKEAPPSRKPTPPPRRWSEGPVYELRIYAASERRHGHLIKRFREHTDRIFRRHGMQPVGYWIPIDGTARQKRRLVYILKHASRYAAYRSWNNFSTDGEWERVIEMPEFKGLLSDKPIRIFLTENDYSKMDALETYPSGGVFELRTYTTNPGKLGLLNQRFRDHTLRLFEKHGMTNIGYWTPFDRPEVESTLIYLIRHVNRDQADANWKAFGQDPEWKKVARESQVDGRFLARSPERLYLKALDFSPLQ